jgi:HD-GYP domain-containing protein (c-di-GMP phosphodiesterase class II)/DNA-binding CsgD family transcriptional regulator
LTGPQVIAVAKGAARVSAMSSVDGAPALRLSELLGVLSFGVDLGMGQPMEHVLRQSMIALGLAERIGLDANQRDAVYFGSLLAWVGCHIDAYEQAKWFGDETVLKRDSRRVDFATAGSAPLFMMRHLGGDRTLPRRLGMVPAFLGDGRRAAESMLENHWRASDDLMDRIGLDQLIRDTVEQSFERWDGRGIPRGVSGSEILVTSQLVSLADVVEVFHQAGGVDAAIAVARERAGTQFDPELVDTFAGAAAALFAELAATEPWQAVTSAEQASRYLLAHERLDVALEAVADFVDVKSPYTIGHSRGVAALAEAAAGRYGLGADDATLLRRAALVHDLGRLGVPNSIWDKPGPLTPAELERARMHVYLTERMLATSPALAPLGAVAGQHHERLDGSGYPRGLTGGDITPAGRILAAADGYQARLEPRPHRPAQTSEQAAAELRAEVHAGRIDGDAARAVLAAAGHKTSKRRDWPAGLTTREVEVLRLLTRGMSNKEIAAQLVISPKTAGAHLEHIYAKLDVSNRAMASLFAAKHGLITVGDT